jgi:hypothetical protein
VGKSCLARKSVIRVALVVLLLACEIVLLAREASSPLEPLAILAGAPCPPMTACTGTPRPPTACTGTPRLPTAVCIGTPHPLLGGALVGWRPSSARLAGSSALRPPLAALVLRRGLPPLALLSSESSSTRTLASASLASLTLCLPLTVANAFFRLRRSRDKSFSSCAFLRGLGVPPASSGSRTPPLNLAARGGFRRPKLFETFGVSRPPGAFLPCFFPANVATATAPAVPPSAEESIRRIRSDGLMLGGVVGAMIFFLLYLACYTKASGQKSEVQDVAFLWFFIKYYLGMVLVHTNSHLLLPEL